MTVEELIVELQKYPKNENVYAICGDKKLYFPNIYVNKQTVDGVEISCHEEDDIH